jgi:ribosomal-protein-serine acetyltransferase
MFTAHVRAGIELKLLQESHAETVFELVDRDREYLREWLPWVDSSQSADDTLSYIRSAREQFASEIGLAAGLWADGSFAGVIGMHRVDRLNRKAEIGYWIGRDFQGKGLMTDCCRVLVTHAMTELGFNRIEIMCSPGNHRSCAIPKRLGFVQEATLREAQYLHGTYGDLHLFAMLKRDWRAD